ncbi:unnamed protein product [Rhodiola kirilowii]
MAFGVKTKLGFIQGHFPRPADVSELAKWERCNSVMFTWIINSVSKEITASLIHSRDSIEAWSNLSYQFGGANDTQIYSVQQDIMMLMQGELSFPVYYGNLIQLWGEEDALTEEDFCDLGEKCKATKCSALKKMRDRRMKLLMGLNEVYATVRSNILQMRPSPTLVEVYNHIISDETQRKIKGISPPEMAAMFVSQQPQTQTFNTQFSQRQGNKGFMNKFTPNQHQFPQHQNYNQSVNRNRRNSFCTYCQLQGHSKDSCYKLIGYPPGHKMYKGNNPNVKSNKSIANNITAGVSGAGPVEHISGHQEGPSQLSTIHDQLSKLLSMLQPETVGSNKTHMAGITCLLSTKVNNDLWIIDSGATDHITPYAHLLKNVKELDSPYEVVIPNGDTVAVTHVGRCDINDKISLHNVLLVPNIRFNLLSVAKLISDSKFTAQFDGKYFSIQDPVTHTIQGIGELTQGLYQLKPTLHGACFSMKTNKSVVQLWHHRLGHVPLTKMLSKLSAYIPSLKCTSDIDFHCDICPKARQTRLPFNDSNTLSSALFNMVHCDIWGPFGTPTMTGARYFLTIVEDFSRCTWVYLMQNKAEAAGHIIDYFHMVKTQFACSIIIVRSDNGSEFLSHRITNFFRSQGCLHQTSCAYSPQQNGVVERKHRHLLEIARALKFQSAMPDLFWGDCILTATYIINRLPSVVLKGKTPIEILTNTPPQFEHMRTFGCLCYVSTNKVSRSKLDPRAVACVFLGYPFGHKGYKVYALESHAVMVSRDIIFYEDKFPFQDTSSSVDTVADIFLPQCSLFEDYSISSTDVKRNISHANSSDGDLDVSDSPVHHPAKNSNACRKSSRVPQPSVLLKDFICNTVLTTKSPYPISKYVNYSNCSPSYQHFAMSLISDVEPKTFAQASKHQHWVDAMNKEIKALEDNNTWTITDLPPGKNAVGSKWIFRIKRKSDGNIERYKARLVARGYTQEEGLDYHETFAPVVKMNTVRTLLAVASMKGWPLFQLDVDNAF